MTNNSTVSKINFSTASFPAHGYLAAMQKRDMAHDPLFEVGITHVQLCPQNCIERLTPDVALALRQAYPQTRFRLHANVRVQERHLSGANLSDYPRYREYFEQLATISKLLDAPAYTVHAGAKRPGLSLRRFFDYARRLAELFECPVGIEGHYPTPRGTYVIETWEDYRALVESGLPYVLDLSHLNIVAHKTGRREDTFVAEALANERCIEVHLSHNDGMGDSHECMDVDDLPWWMALLPHVHSDAVIFYEGNLLKRMRQESLMC